MHSLGQVRAAPTPTQLPSLSWQSTAAGVGAPKMFLDGSGQDHEGEMPTLLGDSGGMNRPRADDTLGAFCVSAPATSRLWVYRMCTGSDLYGRILRLSISPSHAYDLRRRQNPLVTVSSRPCFTSRGSAVRVRSSPRIDHKDLSRTRPKRRCRRSERPGMRAARLADHRQDLGNGRTSRWSYPASTRPSMASSLPASHSGADPWARTVSASTRPSHGFELARVPQRCGPLEPERSRRAHGPAWLRACPRPTAAPRYWPPRGYRCLPRSSRIHRLDPPR